MNSLHRMVTKQLNDLTQKRQSTQLKSTLSYSDDFSLVDEPVSQQQPIGTQVFYPATNTRPIKKVSRCSKTITMLEKQDLSIQTITRECLKKIRFLAHQHVEEHFSTSKGVDQKRKWWRRVHFKKQNYHVGEEDSKRKRINQSDTNWSHQDLQAGYAILLKLSV